MRGSIRGRLVAEAPTRLDTSGPHSRPSWLPRGAIIPLAVIGVFVTVTVLAPLLAPYDPNTPLDLQHGKAVAPSLAHLFGTDPYTRDVLSRAMYGGRVSLAVAGLATVMMLTLGTAYGAVAGYVGGRVDDWMMRIVDALMAIPRVLLVIVVVALWQMLPVSLLIVVIGATGWFQLSRLVRGQVLSLRDEEYVAAAHALGASHVRVVLRHILPNVLPTILAAAALELGHVIVLEAGLSYLGLGVQPPMASWGNMIHDGADRLDTLWWVSVFPGLLIAATAVAASAIGDAYRRQLDPRTMLQ